MHAYERKSRKSLKVGRKKIGVPAGKYLFVAAVFWWSSINHQTEASGGRGGRRYHGDTRPWMVGVASCALLRSVAATLESLTNYWLRRNVTQQKCADCAQPAIFRKQYLRRLPISDAG